MYIWSHGFEVASWPGYDAAISGGYANERLYVITGSSDGHTQTASTTGRFGTGWFWQDGNPLYVSAPESSSISPYASRTPPWGKNGPSGDWGLRMHQPGQTVGPIDPVAPYRLNIQPEGFGDLENVAVSFDCRFEAGATTARGGTNVGICRLTTKFTNDPAHYPDGSNFAPLVVDVNSDGRVELWMLDGTNTNTLEIKVTSTRSLPIGSWFRMSVHLEWDSAIVDNYTVNAYVDGVLWASGQTVSDSSMPSHSIQGFRLGYVIGGHSIGVTPPSDKQDFDNVVMFVHPTLGELTTNYYCIPIWPAHNGDEHDVIRKRGPANSADWVITPGAGMTQFGIAVDVTSNTGSLRNFPDEGAYYIGSGADELVLRPQIPAEQWGRTYDPRQLTVIGVNSIQSFGVYDGFGASPTDPKFKLPYQYFGFPGWMSGEQSRHQNSWPLTSTGSFQFEGDQASMWWQPSPYKQVSGSNWDGLNPNFANMTNFASWSWVDDFEKGAIPMLVRAGNYASAITPWSTASMLLEVCASWSPSSVAYTKKPDTQLIIKDKLFDADRISAPYPSQMSPYMGMPYANTANKGTLLPFMEGFWDTNEGANQAGVDLHFRVSETGALGYDATFAWRFASEADTSLRGYMDQNMHWGHHNPFASDDFNAEPEFSGWSSYNSTQAYADTTTHCVGYSTTHDRLLVFWWNTEKSAYAIAYKNMSTDPRGVAIPEVEDVYDYKKFDGGYIEGRFPESKLVGVDCPYCAVVELSDGTMRFFHCYRDIARPVTDGWAGGGGIANLGWKTGYYNIDMYSSYDGGLTWELEKERIMDDPWGGSRVIRHMVAAADGDWLRIDMQFYDTFIDGGIFMMPGRLAMASGDRGVSWKALKTVNGLIPDGFDLCFGWGDDTYTGDSIFRTASGGGTDVHWCVPRYYTRFDETAAICGAGRGDGSFFRWRCTYNQNGATNPSSDRANHLDGWFVSGTISNPAAPYWKEIICINVVERGERGDEWGLLYTPSPTGEAYGGPSGGYNWPLTLAYGTTALYGVSTPGAVYLGQVAVGGEVSGGVISSGARWDGRFSYCVPTTDPYNFSIEREAHHPGLIPEHTGSWFPAAKNNFDPTLGEYLGGTLGSSGGFEAETSFFDPSGLASDNVQSWGMNEHSLDSVWAGDRVAIASTLVNNKYATIPSGGRVPGQPIGGDKTVMPVCISFMGGWEKRPLRRLNSWSEFYKPQIWRSDWTAARGWPSWQTSPAVVGATYTYPGRYPFTGAVVTGPWTQVARSCSNTTTLLERQKPSIRWTEQGVSPNYGFGWAATTTFSNLAVGTTTQGDTQLMAHGGIVDMCVYTEASTSWWPYSLGNGLQRTEYDSSNSIFTRPQRGFTINTARNNSLTGGSTVYMGIHCNVIGPATTNVGDLTNPLYQGQINIYEANWNSGAGAMFPARTIFSGYYNAPTAIKAALPYPVNIRVALVDGYTLSPTSTYTFLQCMYRENMSNEDWTVSGLLTVHGTATATTTMTEQSVQWGTLDGGFQGNVRYTAESSFFRYGVGRETHMAAGFPGTYEANLGGLCGPFPTNITQNIAARWGGSAGFRADTFTAPIKHTYGTDQITFNSPQMHWRSATAGATESILFYAPQTETTDVEKYYRHNALGMFNINKRYIDVSYATDTTFSSITTTFTVDATQYADAVVTAADKGVFMVDPTSARKWKQNELAGMYVELQKGADTYIKTVLANWDTTVQLESLDSAVTNFVDIWTTASFYGSDIVHFMPGVPDGVAAKAMRVQFAPGTTLGTGVPPEGYWKLGALVPGMTFGFEVPLDWEDKQEDKPNIILNTTDSGIRTAYKQGEPRRTYSGSITGDIDRFRESLRSTIRNLTEYSKRPMILALDSQNPNRESMYCRWTDSAKFTNEGWRFNPETLNWERVGGMSVDFEEEI